MNAKMLAEQFTSRGYPAQAWYMMNVASEMEQSESVRIFHASVPSMPLWPNMFASLRREIIQTRPRAIFGFHPLANIIGALSAPQVGAHFVATQRNPSQSQTPALALVEKWLGSSKHYHANIAVSQSVASSYESYPLKYTSKIRVIHNALPPLPVVEGNSETARKNLKLPTGYIIGSIGRLADQKNVEFLLDVLPLVPSARLVIAGEGPNEEQIRIKAANLNVIDRVIFLGPLTGRDVTLFYKAIDVFVMPSRFEGFGRTLIEAMSCGKPVVASNLEVLNEVSKGAATLLPFDANLWAAAILEYQAMSPLQLDQVAKRSREVAESYTMTSMVDAYLAAIDLSPFADQ